MGLLDHKNHHGRSDTSLRDVPTSESIKWWRLSALLVRYEREKNCGKMTFHCYHGTGTTGWRCCMCRKTLWGSQPMPFCIFCESHDLVEETDGHGAP